MTLLFLFILGVVCGSFINVIIDRLPRGENFWFSRSKCEHCNKQLKSYDLIPLASYILLRGKCRYCNAKIPPRLFVVELISGLLFVVLWLTFLDITSFFIGAFITLALLAIFLIDLEQGVIPDVLVVFLLLMSIAWVFVSRGYIIEHLLSSFSSFLFFGAIFAFTRGRGMGFGDVKLAIPLGFLLGFPGTVIAIYLAFVLGAATALFLVAIKVKKFHGSTIPFGPFLCIGIFVMLVLGSQITSLVKMFLYL